MIRGENIMALPDFKKTEQNKTVIPEWAKDMKELPV